VKRRNSQERDEADAREQAESRREKLLAELKAREEAGRQTPTPPAAKDESADPEPAESDPEPAKPDGAAPHEDKTS